MLQYYFTERIFIRVNLFAKLKHTSTSMLIEMPIYHWIMLLQCSWTFSFACKRVSFFKLKKGKEEGGRNAIVRWPNLKGQSRPSADSVALRQLPKADPHRCARRVSTRGFSFCGGPLRWTPSPAPPTSCPPPPVHSSPVISGFSGGKKTGVRRCVFFLVGSVYF